MANQGSAPAGQRAAPERGRGSRRILPLIVIVGLAGGGYYAWKHYKKTGEIVGMDAEKSKEVAERAKEYRDKAGELLAKSRERLSKSKGDLEIWFKEKDIKLPTREELAATADKYKKKFVGKDEEAPPARKSAPARKPASSPRTTSGAADAAAGAETEKDPLVLGEREFRRGFEVWREAPPDSANEQRDLEAAREHFAAARDHLEKAKEMYPDDPKIDELMADSNRFLYDCMKRTILDKY